MQQQFSLGRLPSIDQRDRLFLIRSMPVPTTRKYRYWNDNGWWGNQRDLQQCVGYSWAHWLEDGPISHGGIPPIVPPDVIYFEAQKIDEFPGTDYEGTSVRAGAKYLQSIGRISSYHWAFDLETIINTLLTVGPVVVGTNWYADQFYPDVKGLIKVGGDVAGGHAYVLNGVNITTKLFRIKNSWGRDWGKLGHAFISFDDMRRLIAEDGEAAIGIETK